MLRTMLKSKIHGARVTQANLYYEGSITIDRTLMEAADLLESEKVEVLNLNTGGRLETYCIAGEAGSGVVCLNGPAARGACVGDQIIVLAYAFIDDAQALKLKPIVVKCDASNHVRD